mgnify:CR=1 FL=1
MIVSWNWLTEYVDLAMTHDDLVDRLTMSGLNHEGTDLVDKDQAIDLEVTSNRADCLGHIGVAREIAAPCACRRRGVSAAVRAAQVRRGARVCRRCRRLTG